MSDTSDSDDLDKQLWEICHYEYFNAIFIFFILDPEIEREKTRIQRSIRVLGQFVADNSSHGQFVARQFVAGQFVAIMG